MYERELNGYYKQAVRWLECGHMQRQKFRQYLVVSAEDYLSQRPEASFEEVCQALGTPQQAAQAFLWRYCRRARLNSGANATGRL